MRAYMSTYIHIYLYMAMVLRKDEQGNTRVCGYSIDAVVAQISSEALCVAELVTARLAEADV